MSDTDFTEVPLDDENESVVDDKKTDDKKDKDGYESICTICKRPESLAGPMVKMAGGLTICNECMQRSFDMINGLGLDKMDMGSLFGMPFNTNTKASKEDEKDDEVEKEKNKNNGFPFGNIRFVFPGQMNETKIKPKKEKKNENQKNFKTLTLKDLPAPHKIKAMLDEHVVGQEKAKKAISVAVYNHYKRVLHEENGDYKDDKVTIEKSNMLMIGPTGSGKTYLLKTLADILHVPLAITDATSLTEAGYIGDDVESVLSKLLANANNDVEKAERGIVFIDEIDKIAKKKNAHQRDVSGESVQQGLLKLLEGADVEVPIGSSSKNAMVPTTTINTKNILFVCGGAFPDLEGIIKNRLTKTSGVGFNADLKDKYDDDPNIFEKVTVADIREYGMIPEFIGRLPVIFTLKGLDEEMLKKILVEPANAIIKQYQKLFEMDEVQLEFDDSALSAIAKKAMEKETGARALRAIIEEYMLDIMYEIPKDPMIGKVTITGDYISGKGSPIVSLREQLKMKYVILIGLILAFMIYIFFYSMLLKKMYPALRPIWLKFYLKFIKVDEKIAQTKRFEVNNAYTRKYGPGDPANPNTYRHVSFKLMAALIGIITLYNIYLSRVFLYYFIIYYIMWPIGKAMYVTIKNEKLNQIYFSGLIQVIIAGVLAAYIDVFALIAKLY